MSSPEALASAPAPEDREPVGAGWIFALALGVVAVFAALFGPLQILLPNQAEAIAEAGVVGFGSGSKEQLLALITGVGAFVAMVGNPLWGLASDRCLVRFGSRLPILGAGALVGAAGLIVLIGAESPTVAVAGWAVVQLGLNGPFAVLVALIADQAPHAQRGLVGSLFGVGQIIGVIGGVGIATAFGGEAIGYAALAVAVLALLAAIVVAQVPRDRRGAGSPTAAGAAGADYAAVAGPPSSKGSTGRGFAPTRDYVWAWLLRFAMNLTNALVLIYMLYFLRDEIGVADSEGSVLVVTVVTLLLAAACAAGMGAVSDRLERRKIFAVAGAVATVVGFAILAFAGSMTVVIVAAAVLGVGWGLFISVDLAIVTSTLTTDRTAGTMLGIANVANSLPQVFSPLLAAFVIDTLDAGYTTLYLAGAAVAVVAAILALPIRSVR